jgi:hypothetical protein
VPAGLAGALEKVIDYAVVSDSKRYLKGEKYRQNAKGLRK